MMNTPNIRMNTIKHKGLEFGVWVCIAATALYLAVNYIYISSGSDFLLFQSARDFFNQNLPTNSQAITYLKSINNTTRAQIVANSYGFAWMSFVLSVSVVAVLLVFFYRYFSLTNKDVFSNKDLEAGDGHRNISAILFASAALLVWQAGFNGLCFKACTFYENQVQIRDMDFYSVALKLSYSLFAIGVGILYSFILLAHHKEKK